MRPLPMAGPPAEDGACCEACAAQQARPTGSAMPAGSATPAGPVTPAAAAPIRRGDDRRITFGGLLVAAGFLAASMVVATTTALDGGSTLWPAIHLALAGAAGCAVAAVLPFFTTALARVAPAAPAVRILSIALVAGGAATVTVGVSTGLTGLAALGGCAYLLGLGGTAVAAFVPLRRAIGLQRRPVPIAYAAALADVAVGVAIATAMVAGWVPVTGAWAALKPAHAWLNVFGFLSIVVAATLIHLAPTVVGARIVPRRSATIALVGLVAGAPLVAVGFAGGWDEVARLGAAFELLGASALAVHAIVVWRARAAWTGDLGWHRFTATSLVAAPLWFLVATTVAAGRILWLGASPPAWDAGAVAVPLALGWIAQVMIGSWTHLIPAIGPGDPLEHAAWRRRLGWMATPRLLAWNAGVAAVAVGLPTGIDAFVGVGAMLVAASLLTALALLIAVLPRRAAQAPAVVATRV